VFAAPQPKSESAIADPQSAIIVPIAELFAQPDDHNRDENKKRLRPK
jgi:hypothetical protein